MKKITKIIETFIGVAVAALVNKYISTKYFTIFKLRKYRNKDYVNTKIPFIIRFYPVDKNFFHKQYYLNTKDSIYYYSKYKRRGHIWEKELYLKKWQ